MCPINLEAVRGGGYYLPFRLVPVDWVAANNIALMNRPKPEAMKNLSKLPECDLIITFVRSLLIFDCFQVFIEESRPGSGFFTLDKMGLAGQRLAKKL